MRMQSMLLAVAIVTIVTLGGCGVSETATVAATVGAAKAREVEQARTMQEQVQAKLDEAYKLAEQKREAAEPAR